MVRYAPTYIGLFIGEEFSTTFQMARFCGSECDITQPYGWVQFLYLVSHMASTHLIFMGNANMNDAEYTNPPKLLSLSWVYDY